MNSSGKGEGMKDEGRAEGVEEPGLKPVSGCASLQEHPCPCSRQFVI
jgi:hypothetical protein